MTDPMVIAAASVVVIGAVSGLAVAVIKAIGDMKRSLLTVASDQLAKTAEVHTLVNGSASKAADRLESLEAQIVSLNAQLGQLQERRVEDAKTKAAGES